MQKGCTLVARTADGGKIRIKGNGESLSGRGQDQHRPKACVLIHFEFLCSIHSF